MDSYSSGHCFYWCPCLSTDFPRFANIDVFKCNLNETLNAKINKFHFLASQILVSELKMLAKQDRQKFFSLMEVFNSSQNPEHPLRPPPLVEASHTKLDADSVDKDKSSYGRNIRGCYHCHRHQHHFINQKCN